MYSAFYGPKRDFGRFGFGEAQASKVSLHWGGRFGVRESEELISGRISGGSENNDSGRLSTPQGGLGKALHFLALTLPPGAQCEHSSRRWPRLPRRRVRALPRPDNS